MAAKYGSAAAVSTEPKQAIAQPKPAPSQQRTMSENIQNRNDQLQQVMDYDKRKFATGGMPGISRDGNSFYGEQDTQSAGAVPAIPGKADPGIVSSVMGGIKPLAVSTAATPSNLVPTQVKGLLHQVVLQAFLRRRKSLLLRLKRVTYLPIRKPATC